MTDRRRRRRLDVPKRHVSQTRSVVATLVGLLAMIVGLTACATPDQRRESTPEEILNQASERLGELESLHFEMGAEGGAIIVGPGLTTTSLVGDVARPDRTQVLATSQLGGMTIEIQIVAIGEEVYLANPLTRRWEKLPATALVPTVLGEDGIARAIRSAKRLSRQPDATIEGVSTYHLTGDLEQAALAAIFGIPASEAVVTGDVWIGKDDLLVRQVRLTGPLDVSDPPDVVRTIRLSRFDEPVTIEPPDR